MTKLKAVPPTTVREGKAKILIFGKPGVGKTFTALDFPAPYFIDTEGGATRRRYMEKLQKSGGAYLGREQGSLDFEAVIGQIQGLAVEKHSYKTLIIDSFTKLYGTFAADAAEKGGDDYGRDKKEANKPSRRLINWIDRVDMNVILVCHEIAQWGVDSKGVRTEVGSTFDGYAKLAHELDLTLNIIKAGPNRIAKIQKSRLEGFDDGASFAWNYSAFADLYGKETIEKDGKQIILASADQIKKFNNFVSIVKLPENQIDKWLKAANAEAIEEIDEDKMAKILAYIETTYIKPQQGEAA